MGRKFIATILSAALAVTAVSAPARADNQDIVKFLAGATALVIIGKAIQDSKRDDNRQTHYVPRRDDRHDHDRGRDDHRDRGNHYWDRDRDQRITMPANCRVDVNTRQGVLRGYSYDCVQRDRRLARALPGQCVTNTRTHRGTQFIYSSQCLARNGVRVY